MAWNRSQGTPSEREAAEPGVVERPRVGSGAAGIGPSIAVKGEVSGAEDLLIEGRVQGKVTVHKHRVTVAAGGKVEADIVGRSITVDGEVLGNLVADECVAIRKTGRVQGNLTAPRVILENGAKLRGSVDMRPEASGDKGPPVRGEASAKEGSGGGGGEERARAAAAPSRSKLG